MDIGVLRALFQLKDEMSPALKTIANNFRQFGKEAEAGMKKAGDTFGLLAKGASAAGAAVAAGLAFAVNSIVNTADALSNMSAASGASLKNLQELAFAGKQVGLSTQDIATGYRKMSKELADGSKETAEAVGKLGLNLNNLRNGSPDQAFNAILASLQKIENPMERTAVATQLLGRSGSALAPLGAGLDEMRARAQELGVVLSDQTVAAADAFGDSLDQASMTGVGFLNNLGSMVTGSAAAHQGVEIFTQAMAGLSGVVSQNREFLMSLVEKGIKLFLQGLSVAIAMVGGVITVIGNMTQSYYLAQAAILSFVKAILEGYAKAMDLIGRSEAAQGARDMAAALQVEIDTLKKTGEEAAAPWVKMGEDVINVAGVVLASTDNMSTGMVDVKAKAQEAAVAMQGKAKVDLEAAKAAEEAAKKAAELAKSYGDMMHTLGQQEATAAAAGLDDLDKALLAVEQQADDARLKLVELMEKGLDPVKAVAAAEAIERVAAANAKAAEDAARLSVLGQTYAEVRKEADYLVKVLGKDPGFPGDMTKQGMEEFRDQIVAIVEALGGMDKVSPELAAMIEKLNKGLSEAGSETVDNTIKLKENVRVGDELAKAYERAADFMKVMGIEANSLLGKMVGVAATLKGLGTKDGKFSIANIKASLKTKEGQMAAIGAGADLVGGFGASLTAGGHYGAGGALSGAAGGAQMGMIAGPWGAAVGAVVGSVVGFFKGKKAEIEAKAKKAAEQIMGLVTDALAGKAEGGVSKVQSMIGPLLKDKATAMQVFADMSSQFTEVQAKLKEALIGSMQNGLAGLTNMIQRVDPAADSAGKSLERFASYGLSMFNELRKQGVGFMDAIEMMGPTLDALAAKSEASGTKLTGAMGEYVKFIEYAKSNPELFQQAEDMGAVIEAMRHGGGINQKNIGELSGDVTANINAMRGGLGATGVEDSQAHLQALAANAKALYELKEAAEQYGLALDDATRAEIEAAENAGLFEGMVDPIDAMKEGLGVMVEVLAAIAEKFGVDLPSNVQKYIDSLHQIPAVPGPPGGAPSPAGNTMPEGSGVPPGNSFAGGTDWRNFGTGELAMLHGQEAVVRPGDVAPSGLRMNEDMLRELASRGFGGAGGGDLEAAMSALLKAQTDELSRAVRDGVLLATGNGG